MRRDEEEKETRSRLVGRISPSDAGDGYSNGAFSHLRNNAAWKATGLGFYVPDLWGVILCSEMDNPGIPKVRRLYSVHWLPTFLFRGLLPLLFEFLKFLEIQRVVVGN